MRSDEVIAYRERWRAVEAVIQQERRCATPQLRWRQLNALLAMAKGLGLVTSDASETGVYARWAELRKRAAEPRPEA